ncbi:MAG: RluA family pseudouridine synthase [Cyanobacteria bacterium]|nr:RluA family pseudouridine synthase [Cyanobacteriota bacterium]MDW8200562.1 RluA family pseudouridine synthase [Cyanobacteriota bacterium SKYGB_h_bin112]
MRLLELPSDFLAPGDTIANAPPTYWYEGRCPRSGRWLRLPRSALAEAIARGLMQRLATDERYGREGKMYGVLLVKTPMGDRVLKAFSGLLQGQSLVEGWVPPIPGRDLVALPEAFTLAALDAIKQSIHALEQLPERQEYAEQVQLFADRLQQLAQRHAQRRQMRQQQRQVMQQQLRGEELMAAIAALNTQSQQDGIERRHLKRQRDACLQPLKSKLDAADAQIQALKRRRRELSRQLQRQMHASYWLTNLGGESRSLADLRSQGQLPTGTGDCCAPKLLHYAATQGWQPIAMAEFWWGVPSTNGDKQPGQFYGACAERCQPLMGFLLSGLSDGVISASAQDLSLPVLYEDEWLIAVDKPAGLLSVPGRYADRQDSALSRLQVTHGSAVMAVHRLDQDTSGVLLLAKDVHTQQHLQRQFQSRQVTKFYEALLAGTVIPQCGTIDLPLWGDPSQRPYQQVDHQRGKPSLTHFQVITRSDTITRVEFHPITGRTHQLRVHAADSQGLAAPIVGDRLYGSGDRDRLYLHAKDLHFTHPHTGVSLRLHATLPF